MFELLERKKLLETPSKQEELLLEVSEVIAEELEEKTTPLESVDNLVKEVTDTGNGESNISSQITRDTSPEISKPSAGVS